MGACCQRHRASCGFTLIELLVAVAVMALMALMGWRALDGMHSAIQGNQRHADAVLALDAGLAQWTTDLDALAVLPHTQPLEFDGRALYLTRNAQSGTAGGVQVVAWSRAERTGQSHWVRWQSAPVQTREGWARAWADAHAWAQGATQFTDAEVRIVALDQWQLYFYRGGAWSNPLSSAGAGTDAEAGNNIPDGIQLVLTVAVGHPLAGTLTRNWARTTVAGTP
ncbi:MAG: prepilin-type N-terminal cleavage/methylation domain-containing protein [Rhodoferax sp.]|nr:prepilin-type N-terminal cleavage/methylation domain-containing protein [Rhodoferax sp.]